MLDKRHLVQNLARIAEEFLSLRGERESLSGAEKEGNAELFREDNARITREFYPDEEELLRDLAAAYHRVYLDLYAAGCRNIQLDDCTWGMIVDEEGYWKMREGDGATLEQEAECYLKVNNLSLENLPEDLVVNTHICRGNYHSTYASSGPYDKVAPYVFAQEKVESFYLEYDDKRSGNFVSLKQVPRGKKVVLGLITSKRPELESKELVKRRIYEAAQYVPLRDLCLSPQCGFASCEIGNKLTEEEQFAKLRLVKEIAEEVWGAEEA